MNQTPVESWAYADLEDGRAEPQTADWGYVDKTVINCRKCHKEWTVAGEYRPYRSDGGTGNTRDHLTGVEEQPVATDARPAGPSWANDATVRASVDILLEVLSGISESAESRDRIALASTYTLGEAAWVTEVAFHAARRNLHVSREVSLGGATRLDLVIDGTAIEFKSTLAPWASVRSDEERATWFMPDLVKLRRGSAPSLMVITVAQLTLGVEHQRAPYRVGFDPTLGLTPQDILDRGIAAVQYFFEENSCPSHLVSLLPGEVPGQGGEVLLAAVLGVVRPDAG